MTDSKKKESDCSVHKMIHMVSLDLQKNTIDPWNIKKCKQSIDNLQRKLNYQKKYGYTLKLKNRISLSDIIDAE